MCSSVGLRRAEQGLNHCTSLLEAKCTSGTIVEKYRNTAEYVSIELIIQRKIKAVGFQTSHRHPLQPFEPH